MVKIRNAENADIPSLVKLLEQVCNVHAGVRPDLFKSGAKKYDGKQLEEIIKDEKRPIFVAENENGVAGYAFCVHKQNDGSAALTDITSLYIDDLCVDEKARGEHIGTALYEYAVDYAKQNGYYNVTLNVWADNKNAVRFYEKIGMTVQKIGMEKIL